MNDTHDSLSMDEFETTLIGAGVSYTLNHQPSPVGFDSGDTTASLFVSDPHLERYNSVRSLHVQIRLELTHSIVNGQHHIYIDYVEGNSIYSAVNRKGWGTLLFNLTIQILELKFRELGGDLFDLADVVIKGKAFHEESNDHTLSLKTKEEMYLGRRRFFKKMGFKFEDNEHFSMTLAEFQYSLSKDDKERVKRGHVPDHSSKDIESIVLPKIAMPKKPLKSLDEIFKSYETHKKIEDLILGAITTIGLSCSVLFSFKHLMFVEALLVTMIVVFIVVLSAAGVFQYLLIDFMPSTWIQKMELAKHRAYENELDKTCERVTRFENESDNLIFRHCFNQNKKPIVGLPLMQGRLNLGDKEREKFLVECSKVLEAIRTSM
ncbi:hypothetical protein [Vibrio sp. R78045]|uniref:hypothetical protein n=1 Tax=Vibrio sp. R78045 TaxID=3093868 RepID=UPI0036F3CF15